MRQPRREIGNYTAKLLLSKAASDDVSIKEVIGVAFQEEPMHLFEPTLVVRQSTSYPRQLS